MMILFAIDLVLIMIPKILDEIPLHERVFCNRSLNMTSIKAIGFDMDYTLAKYKLDVFEKLAYEETLKKLVAQGYPNEILKFQFDHTSTIRGLVIDKKRGNILKMDRHRYVKVAYHGFQELTAADRKTLYDAQTVLSYEEPDFALIDTVFSLAEAHLFMQMVDHREHAKNKIEKSFQDIFYDIRDAMDRSHKDGSIKTNVAKNPEKYIEYDPHLNSVFEELRDSGKKLFLLTNSLWDYADAVMSFLLNQKCRHNETWIDYFDVVITGAHKPGFFTAKSPLYEVDTASGLLRNIEDMQVFEKESNQHMHVFQGGHVKILHDLLGVQKGSEVMYVGDHVYGDILRSKKGIGWRTMLVIEELEHEISKLELLKDQNKRCNELGLTRERLENQQERLLIALNAKKAGREILQPELSVLSYEQIQEQLNHVAVQVEQARFLEQKELKAYHIGFHSVWGELMKAGRQNSRFSAQVQTYACLYTSKVTNIKHYGTHKNYRATKDYMPHDLDFF